MLCWHSFVGVAPGEVAPSRSDGVGSGSKSAQALQTAIKTRVVSTGRRRRAFLDDTCCWWNFRAEAWGLYNAKLAGARPGAAHTGFSPR
jgi:hypothetical protein